MSDSTATIADNSLFKDHALAVITRLQRSVSEIVQAIPDLDSVRPVDLAERLRIDSKLAWKISRLMDSSDPFAAAQYVPGAGGFRIFVRTAQRLGVSKALIMSGRASFERFCELVETHAGNRKAFDIMLGGHAHEGRMRVDLQHRQQMFLGSSYIWGVQAGCIFRTDVLAPSAAPLMFDYASIRGFVDLRRLRPNVPWRITRGFTMDDAGETRVRFEREALDPGPYGGQTPDELPLMREFCSKPLPQCRRVAGPLGEVEYELIEGAVGNTGVLTCVMGEIMRRTEPRYRTERCREMSLRLTMRTPCERVIFDVLIHKEMFGSRIEPALTLFSDLFANPTSPTHRDCDRLPIEERVEFLGTGLCSASTTVIPHYGEMLQCALERCGWDGDAFDVFRVRMEYPPIPANLTVTHRLPDPPEGLAGSVL